MGIKPLLFLILLIFGNSWAAPSSLIVSSTKQMGKENTDQNVSEFPEIYEMNIKTNIYNRFAKTLVESKVRNAGTVAKEATFTVLLPEQAFISEFVMEVGGKSYKAHVKEKEEARNIYDKAVASGQTAAHVSVSARDSNKFTVSVNVEPETKAVFLLTYEELLQRKNGQYELVLNIHPGQIVKHLHVGVNINESRPLKFVRTPSLRSGNVIRKYDEKLNPLADIKIVRSSTATVAFNPDSEKQIQFAHGLGVKESDGLWGQFVVQYDVERDPYGGEVLLQDGYFVHFFAPSDLKSLPKHVVFVLDTSGSMEGTKMAQLKDAMKSILKEIKDGDKVSIIEFNSYCTVWDIISGMRTIIKDINYREPFAELSEQHLPVPTKFNKNLLEEALYVIDKISTTGLTNIIGGLETALYIVKVDQQRDVNENDQKHQPMIIFLTDGYPNVGIRSTEEIIDVVTRLNSENNNIPIFSLSFGDDANKDLLTILSSKNKGFSRHIYEASDASLQLQDFYKQISSPLLSGVHFEYESAVKDVTRKVFPIYFKGSELVVAGKYESPDFTVFVKCVGLIGPVTFKPRTEKTVTSLERLWAYLTVKQILEERNNARYKTELTKKAVDLALKYSFVTNVTSLVVVKPDSITTVATKSAAVDGPSRNVHFIDSSLGTSNRVYTAPSSGVSLNTGGYSGIPIIRATSGIKYISSGALAVNFILLSLLTWLV